MVKTVGALAIGVVVGALGAWFVRGAHEHGARDLAGIENDVRDLSAEQARRSAEIGAQLEEVRRCSGEIASSPAASPSSREALPIAGGAQPNHRTDAIADSTSQADTNVRLLRLESTIAALNSSLEKHAFVVQFPGVEQLRNSRHDVDRAFVARIAEALKREHEAGLAMVRYLTFAEVLAKIGPPTTINVDGNWFYERGERETFGPESFELDFLNGYVVQVHSTDE